jgi:hypothetical protein
MMHWRSRWSHAFATWFWMIVLYDLEHPIEHWLVRSILIPEASSRATFDARCTGPLNRTITRTTEKIDSLNRRSVVGL